MGVPRDYHLLGLRGPTGSPVQYDAEFDMLPRFAPDVVKDEATRTEKLVRGLRLDLKGIVRALRPTTHAYALRLALDLSLHERANPSKAAGRGTTRGQKRKADLQPTVAPQRNLRLGGHFQWHRQELAVAGTTVRELPACRSCGRYHRGRCLARSGVCLRCKKLGHTVDCCPKKLLETTSNQTPTPQRGRVFATTRQETEQAGTVVTGEVMLSKDKVKACQVEIANHVLDVTLLVLDMQDFDVILGMDCFKFKGAGTMVLPKVISAMKVSKLLNQGTWSILTSVVDTREPEVSVSSEPVVREYPDIFPDELPELRPLREIDFAI
ncbi:gag protease polyprotein [Cucumis melo var. makuwa]|uniref:Gag protease polyprotein n=1 Tax=Cucumis melo var. makuwa TaxID=1194695 RepID=A0A5A7TRY8_CUCMM|nr:gag protease polyprotein [Cucumis melo var. makuwa]TYK00201.1 gag protease polyprotein [Cucumis melo var. makuwa]